MSKVVSLKDYHNLQIINASLEGRVNTLERVYRKMIRDEKKLGEEAMLNTIALKIAIEDALEALEKDDKESAVKRLRHTLKGLRQNWQEPVT